MRIRTLLVCVAWLGACAKAEEQPAAADSTAAGMEPAAAPSSPLAAMAGTWNVVTKPTSGSDTTSTLYTLTTTPDTTGWTIQFAGRPTPTPMRVVRLTVCMLSISKRTVYSPGGSAPML